MEMWIAPVSRKNIRGHCGPLSAFWIRRNLQRKESRYKSESFLVVFVSLARCFKVFFIYLLHWRLFAEPVLQGNFLRGLPRDLLGTIACVSYRSRGALGISSPSLSQRPLAGTRPLILAWAQLVLARTGPKWGER